MSWQPVAHQRCVSGLPAVLRWQPTDGDGLPLDPGTVTVDIESVDGTVLETGAATVGATTAERTYTLAAADNTRVDNLIVTWHSTNVGDQETRVDVVGAVTMTVAQIRHYEPSLGAAAHSDAAVVEARRDVEQTVERVCHRSFVPTLRTARILSSGRQALILDRPDLIEVRSIAPTGPDLATVAPDAAGIAIASTCWPLAYIDIAWVHGATVVPRDIKRATARMVRHQLIGGSNGSGIPENAISWARPDGMGTTTLAVPGLREWTTGIPWVDEILQAHTWDPPCLA